MSPGSPAVLPDGHGDSDPADLSLRKDGSLRQERSLRVSSSDDSIPLWRLEEEEEDGKKCGSVKGAVDGWRSGAAGGEDEGKKVKRMGGGGGGRRKGEFEKSASCIIHSRRAE